MERIFRLHKVLQPATSRPDPAALPLAQRTQLDEFSSFVSRVLTRSALLHVDSSHPVPHPAQPLRSCLAGTAVLIDADEQSLGVIGSHPAVHYSHPNYTFHLPHYDDLSALSVEREIEWNLAKLEVREFRARSGLSGKGVRVGVLDTGVDGSHPELVGKVKKFATCLSDGSLLEESPKEPSGMTHGTHVVGLLVSERYGLAPDAEVFVASAMNGVEGRSTWIQIAKGIEWLLAQNIHVLNLSIGAPGDPQELDELLALCANSDIAMFGAVGNVPAGAIYYPASSTYVIGVGATKADGTVRTFSGSRADEPTIVAPGERITSTIPGGGAGVYTGTSQAAPHVTGLYALLKEYSPSCSIAQIVAAITKGAVLLDRTAPARQGAGEIHLANSLKVIQEMSTDGPTIQTTFGTGEFDSCTSLSIALPTAEVSIAEANQDEHTTVDAAAFVNGTTASIAALRVTRRDHLLSITNSQQSNAPDYVLNIRIKAQPELCQFDLVSGNIKLSTATVGAVRVETVSAGVQLGEKNRPLVPTTTIEVKSVSGTINVFLLETKLNRVALKNLSGDVRIVRRAGEETVDGLSTLQIGRGPCDVELSTVSGSIVLHLL